MRIHVEHLKWKYKYFILLCLISVCVTVLLFPKHFYERFCEEVVALSGSGKLIPNNLDVTLKDFIERSRRRFQHRENADSDRRQFSQSGKLFLQTCRSQNLWKRHRQSWDAFFHENTSNIRWTFHKYLNKESTVVEIGGNIGECAEHFLMLYPIRRYIVLEPIKEYFESLKQKFATETNMIILNFGLGKENRIDMVEMSGSGTSKFGRPNKNGKLVAMNQVNTTSFFLNMGLGFFEADLLTLNCEGCEYEVVDALINSDLVIYFRNIQISYHHLRGLGNTLRRWCEFQVILNRTHTLAYQFPLFWESWTRKDLI